MMSTYFAPANAVYYLHLLIVFSWQSTFNVVLTRDVHCSLVNTCDACLAQPTCGWCQSPSFDGVSRCETSDVLLESGCPRDDIFSPKSSVESVNKAMNGKNERRLNPSKVKLKIRPNETIKFTVTFQQPMEYPVDLYYLMDLTNSMQLHRDKLIELADRLAVGMSNITSKFRLGFGSFIDKVAMPYASMVEPKLKNPCPPGVECDPPYGFRNQLPLTDNLTLFVDKVKSSRLSGNLDNAEGGFDAIMQVIVCRNEIKWDEMSRKIIIFATDAIFHYAGDGKLGGIIKRNDEQCHLDEMGYYTESVNQDYPSLGQINRAVVDNKVNVIFSVAPEALSVYDTLSNHIRGSVAGKLSHDSSNIVDLIEDNYKKIVSQIELRDNSSDAIEIEYFSKCLNTKEGSKKTKMCDGIRFGQKVEFDVNLKLTSCNGEYKENFAISLIGIEEDVVVELEAQCSCDCTKGDSKFANSSMCSFGGDLVCGVCQCHPNRHGKECECIGNSKIEEEKRKACQRDQNSTIYCSNRGDCSCGECICRKGPSSGDKIYGKYCECDTFTCAKDEKGRTCGDRGKCCDGTCICNDGWTGYTCGCTTNVTTCVNPINHKICSGNGDCDCGVCNCNSKANSTEQYVGRFCEECATCEGKCADLEPLIDFETSSYNQSNCDNNQCPFVLSLVDDLNDNPLPNDRKCVIYDRDDCQKLFVYSYDEKSEKLIVRLKRGRECRTEVNVLLLVAYIVLVIVILGLSILGIYRLCIYLKDRREAKLHVKRAQQELFKMRSRAENPIYKEPINKYQNPLYSQSK